MEKDHVALLGEVAALVGTLVSVSRRRALRQVVGLCTIPTLIDTLTLRCPVLTPHAPYGRPD